jgi:hypothetical protein
MPKQQKEKLPGLYTGLLQEIESQAAALSSSNPSLALQLLVSNVNSLLVILKVPIRIQLVTV